MTPERIEAALLLREENKNIQQIAKTLGVGRMSVSRALAKFEGSPALPGELSLEGCVYSRLLVGGRKIDAALVEDFLCHQGGVKRPGDPTVHSGMHKGLNDLLGA